MSPEECRALAAKLRQYGEEHPAYQASANEAADHLEATAAEMEKDEPALPAIPTARA